jgi:hypothetical protein
VTRSINTRLHKNRKMNCIHCDNPKVENRDLQLCATCNKMRRRIDAVKIPQDVKPIAKQSAIKQKELQTYAMVKKKVLLNRWCAYHGHPCIPTDVHHQMGREGFADDKGIPLLVDMRYLIPVCREAHNWITEHSKEAIEQGYSYKRIH